MVKTFTLLGAGLMLLAVAAGAFGAHALSDYFAKHPDFKLASWWDTAVQYHMIHALGLFAVAWANIQFPGTATTWAGWLLFAGILIFSGSLYLMVFTRITKLGAITPIGGVALLAGWACLLWATITHSG